MWNRERTTRTERRVIVTSYVTFCAGYHYRLVHPVDEAVDVYTFEGITVLCMVTTDLRVSFGQPGTEQRGMIQ